MLIAVIRDSEADASFGRGFDWSGLWAGRHTHVVHTNTPLLQYGDEARGRRHLRSKKIKNKTEMLETTDIFNNININCIYTKHSLIWSSYTVFTSHVHQVSDHHKVSSSELKPQEECSLQQIWPVWPTVSHTVQGIVFLWQKLCL